MIEYLNSMRKCLRYSFEEPILALKKAVPKPRSSLPSPYLFRSRSRRQTRLGHRNVTYSRSMTLSPSYVGETVARVSRNKTGNSFFLLLDLSLYLTKCANSVFLHQQLLSPLNFLLVNFRQRASIDVSTMYRSGLFLMLESDRDEARRETNYLPPPSIQRTIFFV